jgi:hypothetical protein
MDWFLHPWTIAPDSNTLIYLDQATVIRKKGRIAMPYTRRYNPAIELGEILLTFPICDPIDRNTPTIDVRSIGSYFGTA